MHLFCAIKLYFVVITILSKQILFFFSACARKNHTARDASESEIQGCIIRWFANAEDRAGGRQARAKQKNNM